MRWLSIAIVLAGVRAAQARPLVLGDGEIEAALAVELNLAPGELAHSTTIAPDLWWGVAPRWTVGVIHSDASVDRFEPGGSLCVVKEEVSLYGGCDRSYGGSGIDVRWGALPWLAPRARLLVHHLSVWKPALTLGVLARWTRGRFSITGDPYLQLGLANRGHGNDDKLFLPVTFTVQPTSRWWVDFSSGYDTELAVWSDGFHVPIAGTVRAAATSELELGVTLGFRSLLGPVNTSKERVLFLSAAWRG